MRDLVATTYVFDETRVEPFTVSAGGAGRLGWVVESASLSLRLDGGRPDAGGSPPAAGAARRGAEPGVRDRGRPGGPGGDARRAHAGHGPGRRREFYGATDLRTVTALTGTLDGIPLGGLAPVDPACRFGFSSTPKRPSVTDVVTTIVETG